MYQYSVKNRDAAKRREVKRRNKNDRSLQYLKDRAEWRAPQSQESYENAVRRSFQGNTSTSRYYGHHHPVSGKGAEREGPGHLPAVPGPPGEVGRSSSNLSYATLSSPVARGTFGDKLPHCLFQYSLI
jgi:hypothetical protein